MRFERRYLRRALPVLLAALLLVLQLPQNMAGAELSAPADVMLTAIEPAMNDASAPEAASDAGDPVIALFLNSHEQEQLERGETVRYRFVPQDSDTYIFRAFPAEDQPLPQTQTRLIRESDGRELLISEQSDEFRLVHGLEAGENYLLEVTAQTAGSLAVEVMLDARGRCFDNPISLPAETVRYAKTIVRPRDVHWFRFTAPTSGWYTVRTEKTGDALLDTKGYLMDGEGRMLAANDDILFPGDANFLIRYPLTAGETYYVRISAFSNLTGPYRLVLTVPDEEQLLPESLTIERHDLIMDVDDEHRLTLRTEPRQADAGTVYASSNSEVASVEPDGTVRAHAAGEAVIWAFSYGSLSDRCVVTVRPVEVTGMAFAEDSVSLRTDEQLTISPVFEPANASNKEVRYASSDESVVTVSQYGVLTGISQGEAVVTAVSMDGSFTDTVAVHVGAVRPVYRALVLGEQTYAAGGRLGGLNTAEGVADMLMNQSMEGSTYQVQLMLDSTRSEIIEGIRTAFEGAKETDISLFYINCHGAYENGTAYLRLHDESRITVRQLELMLRDIPGKIIVILDFCQSGAFIGAGGDFEQFSAETGEVFAGGTPLTNGRYTVIASASADEDSYRRSFLSENDESSTAAIMGRSLCEGAGWDIIYDRSVTLKADADRSKQITVQEIYEYTKKRVSHYLEGSGVTQTVHVFPEGDQTVIFGRN